MKRWWLNFRLWSLNFSITLMEEQVVANQNALRTMKQERDAVALDLLNLESDRP